MAVDTPLPRSTPEELGIASDAVVAFVDSIKSKNIELHSLMIVRHGAVAAEGWWEPYSPELPHILFSLSKSFASTAAGLAVSEGFFSLDDTVASFFPEELPDSPSDNLNAMKVRHLLSMSTGNDKDTTGALPAAEDGNWARAFLAQPVEHEPGSHFVYNSGATYMVSAIVQKTTGKRTLDFLTPRLFAPLSIFGARWETCPRGIDFGGFGLHLKSEDIAKFGVLYQQGGVWNERQILPEDWVKQATSKHVSNGDNPESDWNQGYGFQFWRSRHGAYRGDGAFGQFCLVIPEYHTVVSITGGTNDLQGVLNSVWETILPQLSPAPLPANPDALWQMQSTLANLALPSEIGNPTSTIVSQVSGSTFVFPENDLSMQKLAFDFEARPNTATITQEAEDIRVALGQDGWIKGSGSFVGETGSPFAAAAGWESEDTFVAKVCFNTKHYTRSYRCQFSGSSVSVVVSQTVGFGSTERPPIVGTASK